VPELEDQPHPDAEWIASLPLELQGAAKTHGRAILAFVVNAGNYHAGIQTLVRRVQGNNELMGALRVISSGVADLSMAYIAARGWTKEQLDECKTDIKRAALLAQTEPGVKKSNGGIILAN